MNVIQVQNLQKQFKRKIKHGFWRDLFRPDFSQVDAVKDISFSVAQGESVAFLGPNGAGKTTTVKMLTGLVYPTSGEISVLGYKPSDRNTDMLKQIGLVMGNKQGLNWDLTAAQSLNLIGQIYEIPENVYMDKIAELTKLLDVERLLHTQVRRLSLGERMKMELIGSILHSPKILILDEPTIGLDVLAKQTLRKFLRQIQQSGVTLLLTSHDMDDIETVCDRVIVINKGQKVYDDSLINLSHKYAQDKYVKVTFHSENIPQFNDMEGVNLIAQTGQVATYKADKKSLPALLSALGSSDVDDIDILSTPLETIIQGIFTQN